MKQTLIAVLCLGLISIGYTASSQVIKMRAQKFVVTIFANQKTNSDFDSCNLLITIDESTQIIRIFSPKVQRFDIIDFKIVRDSVLKMNCLDNDGKKCTISMLQIDDRDSNTALIIDWPDTTWMFKANREDH